jgi:hypothetical protein
MRNDPEAGTVVVSKLAVMVEEPTAVAPAGSMVVFQEEEIVLPGP